jgi:DNA-binding MarR family transcriptional regulator
METDALDRFSRAYWQAFRELDSLRLRLWETSGLTLPQLRVLYAIRRQPGITARDLSAGLGITVSTTSGLVGKLVERGLIDRTTAADDRRLQPLHLTAAGEELTGELSLPATAFLRKVAGRLGADLPAVAEALALLAAAASASRGTEAVAPGAAAPGGAA